MWKWIKETYEKTLEWLLDLATWVPRKVAELVTDGLVSLVEAIEVPSWLADAGGFLGGMPSGVYWFLDMMAVPQGFAIILGAWLIRFIIRRIPFIG